MEIKIADKVASTTTLHFKHGYPGFIHPNSGMFTEHLIYNWYYNNIPGLGFLVNL